MSAIDIFISKGKQGLILDRDWLTREEKDVVRERFGPEGSSGVWFLETHQDAEQGDSGTDDPDDDANEKDSSVGPSLENLEGMTVAQLKELAAHDELDISGLTLKADIVGRLAAHYDLEV